MRVGLLILAFLSLLLSGCASSPDSSLGRSQNVSQHLNSQLKQWQGTPYAYGGNSLKGIDCSGFVQRTFSDRFNVSLPRTTSQQATVGSKVAKSHLQAGDLVFFKVGNRGNGLHVGIYDKNGTFIHASTSQGVTRSSLSNRYWQERYWQARRL
jgi:probable lipoprotein NlpC